MTSIQEEVYNKAVASLKEHFEGSLIVVATEEAKGWISSFNYSGGILQAIGMARAAEHKLAQEQAAYIEFKDEE